MQLGMVLNESLRLYPPVLTIGRHIVPPAETLGQLWLPPKTILLIHALILHRDTDLWGDDVNEFKPQRFSDGIAKACKHPYGFLAFGMGPRNCIGQTFAIMEAKVVMVKILQSFRVSLSPNYRHAPIAKGTLSPEYGMPVILHSM